MHKQLNIILKINPKANIATQGFIKNYPVNEYYIHANSAIIFGKSDHMWAHLVSQSESELRKLLTKYNQKTNYYYSVEEWMVPLILEYGKTDWIMKTNRYIFWGSVKNLKLQQSTIPLSIDQAHYVFNHSNYQKYTSINYIKDRLQKDISAGILRNGKLIAWGFTHDDGALGFLHVLPKYRKQGLGKQVLMNLVQQRRVKNQPVFCNIVPENFPSINLVKKLGFEFDRVVSWVKLKGTSKNQLH